MTELFTLGYPIKAPDGVEITTLNLRRLKAGELRSFEPQESDGKIGTLLRFVALMNDLPSRCMDELDASDALALIGAAAPFLDRATGATPLP